MLTDMPALTQQQQQQAMERIQGLMAEGMSSGEAIALVSREIRASHTGEWVTLRWDDDEDQSDDDAPREELYEPDVYDDNRDDD